MINPRQISTMSDLRFNTKSVLNKSEDEPVFLFHRSTPKGVLLSWKHYQIIIDQLEDYHLSLRTEEFEKEDKKNVKWVGASMVKKILKGKKQ